MWTFGAWNEVLRDTEILSDWDTVGDSVDLHPSTEANCVAFEDEHGISLPTTFRDFAKTFGPGMFAQQIRIAVPGPAELGEHWELRQFNDYARDIQNEASEHCGEIDLVRRALYFAYDIVSTSFYFWDPSQGNESAQGIEYVIFEFKREDEVAEICDTFWEFVTSHCLHNGLDESDDATWLTFEPAHAD